MMTLTRTEESTVVTTPVAPTLLLAFELGERMRRRRNRRRPPAGSAQRTTGSMDVFDVV
jgi:hypothetical protein